MKISETWLVYLKQTKAKYETTDKNFFLINADTNVLNVALTIFAIMQVWMNQTADNHIFKFLKNKLSRFRLC